MLVCPSSTAICVQVIILHVLIESSSDPEIRVFLSVVQARWFTESCVLWDWRQARLSSYPRFWLVTRREARLVRCVQRRKHGHVWWVDHWHFFVPTSDPIGMSFKFLAGRYLLCILRPNVIDWKKTGPNDSRRHNQLPRAVSSQLSFNKSTIITYEKLVLEGLGPRMQADKECLSIQSWVYW